MKKEALVLLILLQGCAFKPLENSTSSSTSSSTLTASSFFISETSTSSIDILKINREIDEKLEYIKNLLPSYISSDYYLPTLDDERFTLKYSSSNNAVYRNILAFEELNKDYQISLKVEISYESISKSILHEVEVYSNSNPQKLVIKELEAKLPKELNGDFLLPSLEGYKIDYTSKNLEIFKVKNYEGESIKYNNYETNRIIYPCNVNDFVGTLEALIQTPTKIINASYDILIKGTYSINKLPIIKINTLNNKPVEDRENYIPASFTLESSNSLLNYSSNVSIKGRGNSSWSLDKKPYALKFENKVKLLNCSKSKSYVLLANHVDQSLMRNYLAFDLMHKLTSEWQPTMNYVDLYLNDKYQGNYLLCEKISLSSDKIQADPSLMEDDSGYLVELDARSEEEGREGIDFFKLYQSSVPFYTLKEPNSKSEFYSNSKFNYIKDYINNSLNSVISRNGYEKYIDVDSFVDYFIVNELFQNVDCWYASVYFYKAKGEKLKIGPLWDVDLSLGNPGHLENHLRVPNSWYVCLPSRNTWFYNLINSSLFQAKLEYKFNNIYNDFLKDYPLEVFNVLNTIKPSSLKNFEKWNIIGEEYYWYTSNEVYNRKSYEEQVQFVYDYLKARIEFMHQAINSHNYPK